jgi:hypothetical protein
MVIVILEWLPLLACRTRALAFAFLGFSAHCFCRQRILLMPRLIQRRAATMEGVKGGLIRFYRGVTGLHSALGF